MKNHTDNNRFTIGIVSGKLGDVDGVSLEVDKWIHLLHEMGHKIITLSGRYASSIKNVDPEDQILMESIGFTSPTQNQLERLVFPYMLKHPRVLSTRDRKQILHRIEVEGTETANLLFEQIQERDIDVIIAENTNALPMTLIGGMAVYKLCSEKRIATIFHHHDFWWERSRFSSNYIEGLLSRIMPPAEPGLEHVVLSSYASHILKSLKRVQPMVIPNCEDFDNPVTRDTYNADFRENLGFREDDILLVQPTRIVKRKRIEDSLALTGKLLQKHPDLRKRVHFIISLYQGDEPDETYIDRIRGLASSMDIPLHLISDRIAAKRGTGEKGEKLYTNRDVLANADMVLYLPVWEGFGNALLESFAAKVPVVTTTYLVYKTDIKVMRLDNIEIRDTYDGEGHLIIPERAVDEMHYLLTHPEERREITEKNFRIARKEFGFSTLRQCISSMMEEYGDEIRASRQRIRRSKKGYSV